MTKNFEHGTILPNHQVPQVHKEKPRFIHTTIFTYRHLRGVRVDQGKNPAKSALRPFIPFPSVREVGSGVKLPERVKSSLKMLKIRQPVVLTLSFIDSVTALVTVSVLF